MIEADKGVQPWRHIFNPFHILAQTQQAEKVVIIPWHAAKRLTDELGDPKSKIVILSNTARCGGTLLAQIFECTGRCVSYAEPGSIQTLLDCKSRFSSDRFDEAVKVLMRLVCKPVSNPKNVLAYVFKPMAGSVDFISIVNRLYPQTKHVHCYRDLRAMANSVQKCVYVTPLAQLTYWAGGISATANAAMLAAMGFKFAASGENAIKMRDPLDFGVLLWAASAANYLKMRQQVKAFYIYQGFHYLIFHFFPKRNRYTK